MSTPQARAKQWGYEVEKACERELGKVFWGLKRMGSVAYKKAAADLVRPGVPPILYMVVTRDKRNPLLVTMSVEDFMDLLTRSDAMKRSVAIQVKGRERTWIGTLYHELRKAKP